MPIWKRRSGLLQTFLALLAAATLMVACGGSAQVAEPSGEGDAGELNTAEAGATEEDTTGADLPVVRIQGVTGGSTEAAIRLIELNEFDKKNGFDGEFTTVDIEASLQSFLQGETDVTFDMDPITAALLRTQGNDVTTFAPLLTSDAHLLVRDDSPYEHPDDLLGKPVGHDGLQSGTMTLSNILLKEFHDIEIMEDYDLVVTQEAALTRLLDRGELEAVFLGQPQAVTAELDSGMRTIWGPGWREWEETLGGGSWSITIGAHDQWIQENPDLAKAVVAAWDDAATWVAQNPDRMLEEPFPELFGISNPEVLEEFAELVGNGTILVSRWTEEDAEAARALIEFAADEGSIIQEVPDGAVTRLE